MPCWLPGPQGGQMQHQPAGGVRKPPGNADELAPDRAGGGFGVPQRRERTGGSGQVERHRSQHQPGIVGGEATRRQVGQRASFQVGEDLFDDRVPAVVRFGLQPSLPPPASS